MAASRAGVDPPGTSAMNDRKTDMAAGGDPSMEDILASIRRILSEDEQAEKVPPGPPPPAGAPPPPTTADPEDVLVLDSSMIVPDPPPAVPAPAPIAAAAALPPPEPPEPATALEPPPVFAQPPPIVPPEATLVAPEAAAAAASSVGALVRTLAAGRTTATYRGGPTIEEIVREEMRPLLKQWLDTHLPGMVERLVKTEIERVVSRDLG